MIDIKKCQISIENIKGFYKKAYDEELDLDYVRSQMQYDLEELQNLIDYHKELDKQAKKLDEQLRRLNDETID